MHDTTNNKETMNETSNDETRHNHGETEYDNKQEATISDITCPGLAELSNFSSTQVHPDPNARAVLLVEGLSVFAFNPNQANRGEFGFFKDMHFLVELEILLPNADGTACTTVFSTNNREDYPYSTFGMRVEVNSTKTGTGSRRYENSSDPLKSFSKIPNLAVWHNVANLNVLPDTRNNHMSARLNVYDADFYTYKLSVRNATRYEIDPMTHQPINFVGLGNIGRVLGADILANTADNLEVKIYPLNVTTPVTKNLANAGRPYIIFVKATPSDSQHHTSHLVHLYNVLRKPDNKDFVLNFGGDEPALSVCHEEPLIATQFECQTFVGGCGGW